MNYVLGNVIWLIIIRQILQYSLWGEIKDPADLQTLSPAPHLNAAQWLSMNKQWEEPD